ncbi:hypothetical protein [Streptacidiphilus pinicola]|nr:hypothetical protein [Streptacidiphilus pinicola]
MEPLDTLVEFLAATRLALPPEPLRVFRAELTAPTTSSGAPRERVIARVRELLGAPAAVLAEQLDRLISRCGQAQRPLDSATVRRLYAEASDLCDVWVLALHEGLVTDVSPVGTADELYATEGAVLSAFDPADPTDIAGRRLALADCVGQLTELVALDRWGLLPRRDWPSAEVPSLGWPAVLAQAQYRLRQIGAVGAPAEVADGAGRRAAPVGDRRHAGALHLLAALDRTTGLTPKDLEAGHQRIRRSLRAVMPWATGLQGADLAWALRRRPELMTDYGLGPREAVEETAALLPGLVDCLRYAGPGPGPDRLPLSGWELRELFPELGRLLALYRDGLAHGDLGEYRESQNPELLPALVAEAYVEADVEARGGSGRFAPRSRVSLRLSACSSPGTRPPTGPSACLARRRATRSRDTPGGMI